jgi:predicted phosphodiesterase
MKHLVVLLLVLLVFSAQGQALEIQGRVFADRNGNTLLDQEEEGIPKVTVSDQVNTTVTDQDGYFSLTTGDDFPYVFISQPSGYVGAWYYQKASEVNFPLRKSDPQQRFTFIHASDTHVEPVMLPRMNRFRELADSKGAQFIVITGDLIKDALRANEALAREQFELYVTELKQFKTPVYSSVGNHDIFGIERDKSLVSTEHPLYGKKMYRHYLGPNYYSFNVGGVHFVAVDGVDYQNLWYYGGVDALQLKWLESDLARLPSSTPVVTFNHIPFMSPGFSFRTFDAHAFYGPRLLNQNGTLQHRDIVYNFQQVKEVIGGRPYPLALAGHYHAAQEGSIAGYETIFAQTSAITGPDPFEYHGVAVRSGFTLYEVKDGKIVSSEFIPVDLP